MDLEFEDMMMINRDSDEDSESMGLPSRVVSHGASQTNVLMMMSASGSSHPMTMNTQNSNNSNTTGSLFFSKIPNHANATTSSSEMNYLQIPKDHNLHRVAFPRHHQSHQEQQATGNKNNSYISTTTNTTAPPPPQAYLNGNLHVLKKQTISNEKMFFLVGTFREECFCCSSSNKSLTCSRGHHKDKGSSGRTCLALSDKCWPFPLIRCYQKNCGSESKKDGRNKQKQHSNNNSSDSPSHHQKKQQTQQQSFNFNNEMFKPVKLSRIFSHQQPDDENGDHHDSSSFLNCPRFDHRSSLFCGASDSASSIAVVGGSVLTPAGILKQIDPSLVTIVNLKAKNHQTSDENNFTAECQTIRGSNLCDGATSRDFVHLACCLIDDASSLISLLTVVSTASEQHQQQQRNDSNQFQQQQQQQHNDSTSTISRTASNEASSSSALNSPSKYHPQQQQQDDTTISSSSCMQGCERQISASTNTSSSAKNSGTNHDENDQEGLLLNRCVVKIISLKTGIWTNISFESSLSISLIPPSRLEENSSIISEYHEQSDESHPHHDEYDEETKEKNETIKLLQARCSPAFIVVKKDLIIVDSEQQEQSKVAPAHLNLLQTKDDNNHNDDEGSDTDDGEFSSTKEEKEYKRRIDERNKESKRRRKTTHHIILQHGQFCASFNLQKNIPTHRHRHDAVTDDQQAEEAPPILREGTAQMDGGSKESPITCSSPTRSLVQQQQQQSTATTSSSGYFSGTETESSSGISSTHQMMLDARNPTKEFYNPPSPSSVISGSMNTINNNNQQQTTNSSSNNDVLGSSYENNSSLSQTAVPRSKLHQENDNSRLEIVLETAQLPFVSNQLFSMDQQEQQDRPSSSHQHHHHLLPPRPSSSSSASTPAIMITKEEEKTNPQEDDRSGNPTSIGGITKLNVNSLSAIDSNLMTINAAKGSTIPTPFHNSHLHSSATPSPMSRIASNTTSNRHPYTNNPNNTYNQRPASTNTNLGMITPNTSSLILTSTNSQLHQQQHSLEIISLIGYQTTVSVSDNMHSSNNEEEDGGTKCDHENHHSTTVVVRMLFLVKSLSHHHHYNQSEYGLIRVQFVPDVNHQQHQLNDHHEVNNHQNLSLMHLNVVRPQSRLTQNSNDDTSTTSNANDDSFQQQNTLSLMGSAAASFETSSQHQPKKNEEETEERKTIISKNDEEKEKEKEKEKPTKLDEEKNNSDDHETKVLKQEVKELREDFHSFKKNVEEQLSDMKQLLQQLVVLTKK